MIASITGGVIAFNDNLKYTVKLLKESNLIVYSPGGSVINARFYWSKQLEYLLPFMCSKFFHIPMFVAAPSIGPFGENKIQNLFIKKMLKVPKILCVRENISALYMKEIGIYKNVNITADLALMGNINDEDARGKLNMDLELKNFLESNKRVVGITLTDFAWHVKFGKDVLMKEKIAQSFTDFINLLEEHDYVVLLIPQLFGNQNDSEYLNNFTTSKSFVLNDKYDSNFQQYIISKLFALVGLRYHSNIFAAKAGIPFIPVVYEEKMQGFLEASDLVNYSLSVSQIDTDKLWNKFNMLVDNYSEYTSLLTKKKPEWNDTAKRTIELLAQNYQC